ncbi:MAG: tetratricopeptide repeat protein [Rhodothermales bacterium]|nr:tetratricopeptide repeat protein [Rhodothermales bacterium]
MMTRHGRRLPAGRILLIIGVVLLAAGCKQESFIGRRYDNFTAYYNTFYNARKQYAEGVRAIERTANQGIDRTVYLSVFHKPERVSNEQNFNEAIKKSADVLRENQGSKWVDDALLLIGKSYFYLENYVGAEEKFQEVISIGGDLGDESRFWLARTLIASNSFDDAINHIEFSLSVEGLSRKWEAQLRLALGELHVRRSAWEEAALELERGLERAPDRTTAGRATFLLGQVYETLDQYDKALLAYARVQDFKPEYALYYAALVSEIRVEAQHGNSVRALRLVRSMERDDKNFESRAELAYFRGRVFQAMRLPNEAYEIYDGLLYTEDRTINATAIRGKLHHAIGELYRDEYVDFNYAAAHFDTARGSLQSTARRPATAAAIQYAPEAITDGEKQAEVFGSFSTVHDKLVHVDSLMRLGEMDEESFDAFILDLRKKRGEEILEEQRAQARRQAEQQFQAISTVAESSGKQLDAFADAIAQGDSDSGFLFYKDRIRLQEGRLNFIARWGDRPRVENWRRLDAVNSSVQAQSGLATDSTVISARQQLLDEMELPEVDFSEVPRDEATRSAMEEQRAQIRYELANVLFLSMERPDSAAAWYRMVIEDTGDLPVAQRAYYALAEVQRALGDSLSASNLYARVLDLFPNNDFSDRVRGQLGMAPTLVEDAPDSTSLADAAYDRAYDRWSARQYAQAITDMLTAAESFPLSDMAPRAWLAVGAMYLEWAMTDSLDIYALPLPDLPDSLLAGYAFVDSLRAAKPVEPAASGASAPANQPVATPTVRRPVRTQASPAAPKTTTEDAPMDSLALAPADTLALAPADTLAPSMTDPRVAQDTLDAARDSLDVVGPAPDSLAIAVESARVIPNRTPLTLAEKMSAIRPVWAPIRIDRLYGEIVERYPRTPYADVANRRLKAIAELRPEGQALQMVEEIEQQAVLDALSPEERQLKGPEPIDLTAEGWVLVVASFPELDPADGVRQEYVDKGYRSAVLKAPTRHRVIVGIFATLDEARAGLAANKEAFPANTWFLDLRNPR